MSTTNTAQVEIDEVEHLSAYPPHPTAPDTISDLKRQTAQRLAAHRALRRRPSHGAGPELFDRQTAPQPQSDTRAMRIASAVAERYAQSQSYRDFLAAETQRALAQARAAAQSACDAEAVAIAQQQLLCDLESWTPEDAYAPLSMEEAPQTAALLTTAALTVRLFEGAPATHSKTVTGVANAVPSEPLDEEEREALDEEIAFRQSPVFEEAAEAAIPLTANLIEFPRQLVASRKVRPRLAEGPLREESAESGDSTQLRIFEVESGQISTVAETDSSLPEWSSIRLSASPVPEPEIAPQYAVSSPPPVLSAPLSLRLMAAAVDGILLMGGLLGFSAVVACTAGQIPVGQTAALGAAVVLAVMFLAYQLLFFTFGEATPGMRYARIGLCTLSDDNPSRAAMRRRIVAVMLATCPLCLGLLWAAVDDDGLGWHDRISRMYQRSY